MTKGPRINYKKLENNWERLIRFDEIRFFKLVEIAYYSIISFFLAIILGPLLNILTPKLNDEQEDNFIYILIESAINFALILIVAYYIYKIIRVVPFFLNFSDKYISSLKGENEIALGFVISMILFGSQKRLNQNIVKIENFIEKKIFNFLKKKDQTDEENKDI
jgi:hypothetical protein